VTTSERALLRGRLGSRRASRVNMPLPVPTPGVISASLGSAHMQRYLSLGEVADRCGLQLNTLKGYLRKGILPAPDAQIGRNRGWTVETIQKWEATRRPRSSRSSEPRAARSGGQPLADG
jgi:predicted DNA-binding transcriptional regulator AlpA